ncbi:MAG: glycosyltransferase family 39 protein [Chloroflexi bacterium]|nr:glycosyltransferase family 39 protein [Chloroflexota bacterium]
MTDGLTIKRHLLILLVLTVLIRGVMFISYPLGGQDASQGFYRYNVAQILAGDWQIGNLRYAPGFPLFMAPVSALGDLFGRFDDRIELLFQLTLASLIPFLLYDILRSRHSPRAAFVAAILSCVEPFSLQWAHYYSPIWWIALCLVSALWLLHHAERRRSWRLVCLAGLVTGLGILGRWNYAPVALGLVCLLWWVARSDLRRWLRQSAIFSASAASLVLLVHVTIQVPATGVWNLNCTAGVNLLETIQYAGLALDEANGPHSKRLLHLSSLEPLPSHKTATGDYPLWSSETFHLWRTPGTWATELERAEFTQQIAQDAAPYIVGPNIQKLVNWLFFYLGPCDVDHLLRAVYIETIFADPLPWSLNIPVNAWELLQPPLTMGEFPDYTLPPTMALSYEEYGGRFGFWRAYGRYDHYTGQWVWRPGIEIFSRLWAPLNALRFLVFPALVWALFTRHRVYTAIGFLLLLYVFVLGAIDYPEQRIYAIVYPLGPVLVGGFLVALWGKSRNWIASR